MLVDSNFMHLHKNEYDKIKKFSSNQNFIISLTKNILPTLETKIHHLGCVFSFF